MMKCLLFSAAFSVATLTHAHGAQTPRPGYLDGRVTSVVYQPNNVVTVNATY
ncbi:MAG: conjugal transfer protein TrbG, partial [Mesorhizobium sp.]